MGTEVSAKKVRRKRMTWIDGSEEALLELWQARVEQFRTHRNKGHIYAEISDELSKLGFSYSAQAVHVKVQNFMQRYRKEKALIRVSGGLPSRWSQYEQLHEIMDGFEGNLLTEVKPDNNVDSAISLLSPCTTMSSQSPQLPRDSPSPEPSTSSSSIEPAKKKKVLDFRATIMNNFEKLTTDITDHLKRSEENERELIALERRKAESLDRIAKDNAVLRNALMSFLIKNE